MDELTRITQEKHIEAILHDSSFLVRQKTHPELCPCYRCGRPCHDTLSPEELNCQYCLCPEYDSSKEEGGCKINSDKGKWFPNIRKPTGRVWDCSDCDYPHRLENARKIMRRERDLSE